MGEAKRKKQARQAWPEADRYDGDIDLHVLPPAPEINGARMRQLTSDTSFPDGVEIVLRAYRVVAGTRTFHVGFCIGDGTSFSAMGIAVIERLSLAAPAKALYVVPLVHEDIAWDIVMRHLRSFQGDVLLFAFADSDVYDAGTASINYSKHIRQFDPEGTQYRRLTDLDRQRIREKKASILHRPPPPKLYEAGGMQQEEAPWIFRVGTPAGKVVRVAVWDGRRDYAHEFPAEITRWVGGDKIAIVQVDSPVGVNRRSALELTNVLAKDFDGIIHWARDTETFQSILRSFIRLDLDSVGPPLLPEDWDPEIMIIAANSANAEG